MSPVTCFLERSFRRRPKCRRFPRSKKKGFQSELRWTEGLVSHRFKTVVNPSERWETWSGAKQHVSLHDCHILMQWVVNLKDFHYPEVLCTRWLVVVKGQGGVPWCKWSIQGGNPENRWTSVNLFPRLEFFLEFSQVLSGIFGWFTFHLFHHGDFSEVFFWGGS